MKAKYRGTVYDVYLKDTRKGSSKEVSMMSFIGKNKKDVEKQAKKIYKPFMKITKIKLITRVYR